MALFSTNLSHHPQSTNLVEFRAGKMQMRGDMVQPDSRKGLVYVYQSDDGLMHFCWKDRTTGGVEDDLIIFPDDVEFTRVSQCTTGRVFLLRFKNSQKKMFFWMQAFKDDQDEENCRKVNEYLNNPPVPGAGRLPGNRGAAFGGGGSGADSLNDQFAAVSQLLNLDGAGSGTGEDRMDLNNALQGMDQQQLMQLLQLVGGGSGSLPGLGLDPTAFSPATTTTQRLPVTTAVSSSISTVTGATSVAGSGVSTTTTATALSNNSSPAPIKPQQNIIQTSDLRNILANMGVTAGGTQDNPVDLTNVLNAKNVAPILSAGGTEAAERLLPHLPSEPPATRDSAELLNTLHSSQFKQAVGIFGDALQSGQLGPCMRQFGFPDNVIKAVQRGDVESVAELLELEAASKKRPQESTGSNVAGGGGNEQKKSDDDKNQPGGAVGGSPDKKKNDDDAMDLD